MRFYVHVIEDNCSNQRVLFSTFEKLVHLKAVRRLPSHDNALDLANKFADFFENKVQAIRENLSPNVYAYHHGVSWDYVLELNEFAPANATELSSLTRPMSAKSCILDPIPGVLMRDCFDVLLPVITQIVNLSIMLLFLRNSRKLPLIRSSRRSLLTTNFSRVF